MVVSRLELLFLLFCITLISCAPAPPSTLAWYRYNFHNVNTTLKFGKNQRLLISCELGSYGTIIEVTEACFNSCSARDCETSAPRRELFTCNKDSVGPITLRTFNPNPGAVSFRQNATHYFTSLNLTFGRRTLCEEGMKFQIIIDTNSKPEDHSTTQKHPLLSSIRHAHHTLPARSTHAPTTHTTEREEEIIPTTKSIDNLRVTEIEKKREHGKKERKETTMKSEKIGMTYEELQQLDLLTNMPWTPVVLHGQPLRTESGYTFERIGSTVVYGEDGEPMRSYEMALALGIDLNSSKSISLILPITIVILMILLGTS